MRVGLGNECLEVPLLNSNTDAFFYFLGGGRGTFFYQ